MGLALIGLLLTMIWLIAGIWYVAEMIGLENFLFFLPSEIGQFLTGFLLPLALLWLILGYLHFAQRLRRLEEGLWHLTARRRQREDPDEPQSPSGGGSWLDRASAEPQGGSGARPRAGPPERPPDPRSGASVRPLEPSRPSAAAAHEQARGGGLASEVFTSRMRDRMASTYQAPARSAPPVSAEPNAVSRPRSTSNAPSSHQEPRRPAPNPAPTNDAGKTSSEQAAASKRETASPQATAAGRQQDKGQAPQKGKALRLTPVTAPASPPETSKSTHEPSSKKNAVPEPAQSQSVHELAPATTASEQTARERVGKVSGADPTPSAEASLDASPTRQTAKPSGVEARPLGFRHLVRITSMELNGLAMDMAAILCRDSDHARALKGYDRGEKDVFFQLLYDHLVREKQSETIKRLDKGRGGALVESYLRKFETLAEEAGGVDRSGALGKSLEAMPIGRLYGKLQALQAARAQA